MRSTSRVGLEKSFFHASRKALATFLVASLLTLMPVFSPSAHADLAALNPNLRFVTSTADGFTVQIRNYDAAYTFVAPTVDNGSVTAAAASSRRSRQPEKLERPITAGARASTPNLLISYQTSLICYNYTLTLFGARGSGLDFS